MCDNIDIIINLANKGDIHGMIYAMKEFVPEYKSQHSKFESIDKEIEGESITPSPSLQLKAE